MARIRFARGSAVAAARILASIAALTLLAPAQAFAEGADDQLADMSLEDLMDLEVTGVSRKAQRLVDAAASVSVITNEDIQRSGATSVPEVLRLIPGIQVARIDANKWAITIRGLNGEFANKLLVMVDGRSVYTPLFGGTYWDVQDLMLHDVDRIEVIRGPGGVVWGANAVNGVISIITKRASETQGVYASGLAGNQEYLGEGRYGGAIGERTHYRVYARGFERDDFHAPGALEEDDDWWQARTGFRIDSDPTDADRITFQGDWYKGESNTLPAQIGPVLPAYETDVQGFNLLARWEHRFSDEHGFTIQSYFDRTDRDQEGTLGETRNTFDIEIQHDIVLLDSVDVVWGFDYRFNQDETDAGPIVSFVPEDEELHLATGFVNLEWRPIEEVSVAAGVRLEYNSYTAFEYAPTIRGRWTPVKGNAVWAAISRAVRTPARTNRDALIQIPSSAFPISVSRGSDDVDSEDLLAFEAGYRNYMIEQLSFQLSLFYQEYKELTAAQVVSPPGPPPVIRETGNLADGHIYGGEVELGWEPYAWMNLYTGYSIARIDIQLDPGAILSPNPEGSTPRHQWYGRAWFDLPFDTELDFSVYYVSELDDQLDAAGRSIDAYWRGDLRLAWQPIEQLELELVGQNLFEKYHAEFGSVNSTPSEVPRSIYGRVNVTF